jgi:hypothetical protein
MRKPLDSENQEYLENMDINSAKRNDNILQEHGEIDITMKSATRSSTDVSKYAFCRYVVGSIF